MRIWWLDPNGSDLTGNGTYALPYQTFAKALSVFHSEDQIRLKDGVYRPTDSLVFDSVNGSIFADTPLGATIQPTGVASSPAVIQVSHSTRFSIVGLNILQAQNPTNNTLGIQGADVTNFLVYTCDVSAFAAPSAVSGLATVGIAVSGYGRVEDCAVHDMVSEEEFLCGIYAAGNVDIIGCTVYSLSGTGTANVLGISHGGSIPV